MSASPAAIVPTRLRRAPVRLRRTVASLVAVTAIAASLSACFLLPLAAQDGSDRVFGSIDKEALAEAITDSSPNIESTYIAVTLDGVNHALYVLPTLTSDSLTKDELDDVLRISYDSTLGDVKSIQVETEDLAGDPLDIATAAAELGIQFYPLINSVSYSTVYLAEAYGE